MEFLKSMNWTKFSCLPGDNSSFYSCVLSDLALYWKRGWGDLVLIQTSLFDMCFITYQTPKRELKIRRVAEYF